MRKNWTSQPAAPDPAKSAHDHDDDDALLRLQRRPPSPAGSKEWEGREGGKEGGREGGREGGIIITNIIINIMYYSMINMKF